MKRGDWIDLAVSVVFTAGSQAEVLTGHDLRHKAAAAISCVLITGGLAVRRRLPLVCGGLALGTLVLQQLLIGDVEHASAVVVAAIALATYSLGAYGGDVPARIIGGLGAAAFLAASIAKDKPVGDLVFVSVVLFAPWFAGMVIRARHQRVTVLEERTAELEQAGAQRTKQAVDEERARIARELHDVVAHAMSVIVVQAGAERMVLPPEQASTRAVLEAIEHTSRQALGEMRRLLGMMRAGEDEMALAPQPSLLFLPDLCDQVSHAGLPVELEIVGEPSDLPPGVDVSAYRIVQEALTNALKHAGPASARVTVRHHPDELEVEVTDNGRGARQPAAGGHGLVGMQERVAVYGGKLRTGNRVAGGYAVHVRLPLKEAT
jgi:signal transduction histidine kinase